MSRTGTGFCSAQPETQSSPWDRKRDIVTHNEYLDQNENLLPERYTHRAIIIPISTIRMKMHGAVSFQIVPDQGQNWGS